jgi:hypothetical protein
MFFAPVAEQFKQTARQDFEQLYRFGSLSSAWSTVRGRENGLLRLEEAKRGKQIRTRNDAGIQTIAIDSIAGSESRDRDFDRKWRPLKRANQERWTSIAVAKLTDVPLPAIDLIKVGLAYFVRDGHHRISVAKHSGQLEIEANVTEWHMMEGQEVSEPVAANHQVRQFGMTQFRQAGATGAAKLMTMMEGWQDGASLRSIRPFNRSEKPFNSGSAA